MTDATANTPAIPQKSKQSSSLFDLDARTRKRNASESRFKMVKGFTAGFKHIMKTITHDLRFTLLEFPTN